MCDQQTCGTVRELDEVEGVDEDRSPLGRVGELEEADHARDVSGSVDAD